MFFRRKASAPPALTLEGALGPNDRLDLALGTPATAPEAMCVADGALLVSSGNDVLRMDEWGSGLHIWQRFNTPVTALAASSGGQIAIGLGATLQVRAITSTTKPWPEPKVSRISDLCFLSEDELAITDPGYAPDAPLLTLAPWDEAARGQVVALSVGGGQRLIAGGLHCPIGMLADGKDLLITETERARIVDSAAAVRQTGLPAYLGRLRKTRRGYALACLSRRDPLIEFLKTEADFVRLMKDSIDPRHWIAPRERPDFAHDLPITLGATRLHGRIKPWAPSFSYGLVIELDDRLMPIDSAHSRANGQRHAITDVCEWNGDLIALSRASGEILNLGAI